MTEIVQTLLIAGFVCLLILAVASGTIIFLFFKKEQRMRKQTSKVMSSAEILKQAQEKYSIGAYAESIRIIKTSKYSFVEKADIAEAYRILGWSYYYLGIKGPVEKKITNLLRSKASFEYALKIVPVFEKKTEMSIYNGLPLALWILGKKKNALKVSDTAIKVFPEEPSVWNTRSILLRWGKKFKESVPVCSMVSEAAIKKGDYLTAGHGKQNKGDALKELGEKEAAKIEYRVAKNYYQKHEEVSGKSAKPHIESVEKKIAEL